MKKTKTTLHSIISWIDDNILLLFAGFLLAFIPLYPKLPLFDALPGYIVRVRLEDIFVLIATIIWLIQLLRKKVEWKSPVSLGISLYLVVGALSILSGMFLVNTIPLELLHIGKSALHYFRYIEYFILFFIVFSAIRSKKDAQILVLTFILTLFVISVYGYGQKMYEWPLFSTMNREFSKGEVLYLTEHARLQSTFGGHYDLAAFMVIALPITFALFYKSKNPWVRLGLVIAHFGGLWTLILSASRASFIAYIVASFMILFILALEKKGLLKKAWWFFSRSFVFTLIVTYSMLKFGQGMYERLMHVLEGYPELHYYYHTYNHERKMFVEGVLVSVGLRDPHQEEDPDMGVLVSTDQLPTNKKPSDVYADVPDKVEVATVSADGTKSTIFIERDRTWSDNALKYGLSFAIRLDTLWPNAIKGFQRNPLVGSGYATLNKEGAMQFTEADSTDNNYLRTLGETGLLGVITFYGIIGIALIISFRQLRDDDPFVSSVALGFFAASIGLLLNATYIDVYAASKVAFTYWGMTGVIIALYYLKNEPSLLLTKRTTTKTTEHQETKKQKRKTRSKKQKINKS